MNPTLDQWTLWRTVAGDLVLSGFVGGHPQVEDGKAVRTSAVTAMAAGVARTKNTTYTLLARCKDPIRWRLKHYAVGLNGAEPVEPSEAPTP